MFLVVKEYGKKLIYMLKRTKSLYLSRHSDFEQCYARSTTLLAQTKDQKLIKDHNCNHKNQRINFLRAMLD